VSEDEGLFSTSLQAGAPHDRRPSPWHRQSWGRHPKTFTVADFCGLFSDPPSFATLRSKAPKGDQWLHEIKFDGYRIQVRINRGRKKVFTRNGLDWTKRFSAIAGALDIPGEAIIDGEVVVTLSNTRQTPRTPPA